MQNKSQNDGMPWEKITYYNTTICNKGSKRWVFVVFLFFLEKVPTFILQDFQ